DRPLLFLNLAFLATVAFIPLPTAVVGRHPDDRGAVVLFAIAGSVGTAWLTVIRVYLLRHRDLLQPNAFIGGRAVLMRSLAAAVSFASAAVVALVMPVAGFVLTGLIAAFFTLPVARPLHGWHA